MKTLSWIDFFVQPDNSADFVLSKVRKIGLGRVEWITIFNFAFWMGPGESQKLARQHPIEIAIFNPLIVLVLFDVESGKVEKIMLNGLLQTVKTIKQRQIIRTMAKRGIPKG